MKIFKVVDFGLHKRQLFADKGYRLSMIMLLTKDTGSVWSCCGLRTQAQDGSVAD